MYGLVLRQSYPFRLELISKDNDSTPRTQWHAESICKACSVIQQSFLAEYLIRRRADAAIWEILIRKSFVLQPIEVGLRTTKLSTARFRDSKPWVIAEPCCYNFPLTQ